MILPRRDPLEQQHRAPSHLVNSADLVFLPRERGIVGVEKPIPAICLGAGWQCELHHVVVGVENDKQGCVLCPAA